MTNSQPTLPRSIEWTNLGVALDLDVLNLAVLLLALAFDLLGEVLIPVGLSLTERHISASDLKPKGIHVLFRDKHVRQEDTLRLQRRSDDGPYPGGKILIVITRRIVSTNGARISSSVSVLASFCISA
jgi:hypothetical protein